MSTAKTVFFISPHLDDVALSCPKAISALNRQGFAIKTVTIFSQSTHPHVAGRRAWEKVSYDDRKREDLAASKLLNAQAIHLDFLDAPYREEKLNSFNKLISTDPKLYPEVIANVTKRLETLVNEHAPLKIFCPLGIGWHIDHLITFEAIQKLRESLKGKKEIEFYFYEDRPYAFISGSYRLRLAEIGTFSANQPMWYFPFRVSTAIAQAYHWSFSPMMRATQPHFLATVWSFILNLRRNLKAISKTRTQAALVLQLAGSPTDLDFAYDVAKSYPSQFPYLYRSDAEFKRQSLKYAQALSPNASYAERIWIL